MSKLFRRLLPILAADKSGNPVAPSEIELLQTGEWNTPYHGHFVITESDLQQYKQNAENGVRKALPIDWEHNSIGGASGWLGEGTPAFTIKDNAEGGKSLWASVNWTPAGEQSIKDREYRFISPEFADEDYEDPEHAGVFLNNVLIGAGLTNRPLFKNLTAIAANDGTQNNEKDLTSNNKQNIIYLNEENNVMDLKNLLAKKIEDLSVEEKAFVVEHKTELTDEQVTALTEGGVIEAEGETAEAKAEREKAEADAAAAEAQAKVDADAAAAAAADADAATIAANDKTKVSISASELASLKADAAAGKQASDQLAKKASEEHVASMLFNEKTGGKMPVTAKDKVTEFYHELSDKQKKAFDAIIEVMPSLKMFGEIGDAGKSDVGTAAAEVNKKAAEMVADEKNKGLTLAGATRKVLASDVELKARLDAERKGDK